MRAMLAVALLVGGVVILQAEYYRVTVKRIEKDLYRDVSSKTIIETKYCYEYAHSEPALLKWEGRYGDNYLLFESSDTKCDVVALR